MRPDTNMKKSPIKILACVIALIGLISNIKPVQAQGGLDLTISPPVAYLQIKPGARSIHTITIENTSSQDLKIDPSIKDFSTDPVSGLPILMDKNSFEYFVSVEQQLQPIELEPTQKAQLTLVIAPPQNAPEKEYPLSVVFEAQAARDLPTQNSQLHGSVASNLIILVSEKNEIPRQQTISDFGVPKIVDSFRPLELKPILKNENLAASAASGSAVIKNWLGKEVASFQFFPDNVLGFSQRPLRALDQTKPDSLQPIPFRYDPTFLIGPYTIEYTIQNQDSAEAGTTTTPAMTEKTVKTVVLAVPIFVLAAILAGLVVAIWYWRQEKQKNPFS